MHITRHAIDRYRERVIDISDDEVRQRLSGPAFDAAERIGAPAVILPSGHKAIIDEGSIVTIVPAGRLLPLGLHRQLVRAHGT